MYHSTLYNLSYSTHPYDRVLRRIFGAEREKASGGWRKLHNEDLHSMDT
jgi:hypothetical protein